MRRTVSFRHSERMKSTAAREAVADSTAQASAMATAAAAVVEARPVRAASGGFNLNWFDCDLLVGIGVNPQPHSFRLRQNHPNPFNPQTTISFDLPRVMRVSLRVYDISGRLVAVLLDDVSAPAGRNELVWQGRDFAGQAVSSGSYIYRLQAGGRGPDREDDAVEMSRVTVCGQDVAAERTKSNNRTSASTSARKEIASSSSMPAPSPATRTKLSQAISPSTTCSHAP